MGEGKNKHLVPNALEQAALTCAKAMRDAGKSLRDVAKVWAEAPYNLSKLDAKSVKRIIERAHLGEGHC